jgi:hypothetical protein
MWSFEHTERTTAAAPRLWERYSDPASWPDWDHETESVTLDGPFAAGTRGRLKPKAGPATKFEIVEVTDGRSFTDVSFLPLARMRFSHTIDPQPDGAAITHKVTITGPLSPLFGRLIGKKVAAELPGAMRRLGELAAEA